MLYSAYKLAAIFCTVPIAAFVAPAVAQNTDNQQKKRGWSAADEYWDPAAMAEARRAVQKEHGAAKMFFLQGERLEYRSNDGSPIFLWDGQGWYGGDKNKIWVKTEGEYSFDEAVFEDAEMQALWSRAITRYFDVQAGVRQDFAPGDDRTFGVIGLQGLAPYWFEVDIAAFVSDDGDVSARVELEYELLLTQRLILQPRTELNFAVQSVAESGIGSGLSTAEIGARLRYEIKREFAPYIGVEWERSVGETADLARADGEDPSSVSFIAGLRLWF
ncbi:MAG: copper resistance protein B [Pseudomonadota bacterium]